MTPFQQLFFRISQSIKVEPHVLTKAEASLYDMGEWDKLAPKKAYYGYSDFDVEQLKAAVYLTPNVHTIASLFDKKEVLYACYDIYEITPFWGKPFYLLGDYGNDFYSHPMQVYAPCTISKDWEVACGLICYDVATKTYFVQDYMEGKIPGQLQKGLSIEDFAGKRPYSFQPKLQLVHLNFSLLEEQGRGTLKLTPVPFTTELSFV